MIEIKLQGETCYLLPEKALFRPQVQTLYIADTHFGKATTFRHHALYVPEGSTVDDLKRLSQALSSTQAQCLVILGDLLHAVEGRDARLLEQLTRWRDQHPDLAITLVRGNHDRGAGDPPPEWNITCVEAPYQDTPFVLHHKPNISPDGYTLAGHLHPAVELAGKGKQILRLPCFWIRKQILVLPAFTTFTGRQPIKPTPGDQIYVIAEGKVLPVSRKS